MKAEDWYDQEYGWRKIVENWIDDDWTIMRNKCANCESWYTLADTNDQDDTYCWKESCYAA